MKSLKNKNKINAKTIMPLATPIALKATNDARTFIRDYMAKIHNEREFSAVATNIVVEALFFAYKIQMPKEAVDAIWDGIQDAHMKYKNKKIRN